MPLHLRLPGVVWLCAGRPEKELPQLFRPEIAIQPFLDGLPPMGEGDIRAMLLDNLTGELCKRLISQDQDQDQDQERGAQIINPFINKVAKAAQGLPLYVRYVINDIWEGHYRVLDAGERLPSSLSAYHEKHLRRCAVGSLHQVLTPIVALLAVVYEPLSLEILAALLRQRTLIPAGEEGVHLTQAGLAALESMLHRQREEDGQISYTLHHHSLRQHIQESPHTRQAVATAREFLGNAALQIKPDAAARYLYLYGINHLVEAGAKRHPEALQLLTRFDYLMARFYALADKPVAADLRTDWQTYLRTGGVLDDQARIWEAFLREKEHILRCSDKDWPAYKILLQLAIEHADDSPITQQAEAWLAQPGNCDWVWLRNPQRPDRMIINPVIRVFDGHSATVNGALMLDDGRLLSWSNDRTLRLWDNETGNVLVIMEGCIDSVKGAIVAGNGNIVSWEHYILRMWNGKNGTFLTAMEGHTTYIQEVKVFPNGNILSLSGGSLPYVYYLQDELIIWDANGDCLRILKMPYKNNIIKVIILDNDRFLSYHEENGLRIWSNTGELLLIFKEQDEIKRVDLLINYHILLNSEKFIKVWDILTDRIILCFEEGEILAVNGKKFLIYCADRTIQLWDGESCQLISCLELESNFVFESGDWGWEISGNNYILAYSHMINEKKSGKEKFLLWEYKNGIFLCSLERDIDLIMYKNITAISNSSFLLEYSGWPIEDRLSVISFNNGTLEVSEYYKNYWKYVEIKILQKSRILLIAKDNTLKILDSNILASIKQNKLSKPCYFIQAYGPNFWLKKTYEKHIGSATDLKILPDKRILSWDRFSLGLWDMNGNCFSVVTADPNPVASRTTDDQMVEHLTTAEIQILTDGRISIQNEYSGRFWDTHKNTIFMLGDNIPGDEWLIKVLPNGNFVYVNDDIFELWLSLIHI